MAIRNPSPSSPRRFAAGMTTSSKCSSAVLLPRIPSLPWIVRCGEALEVLRILEHEGADAPGALRRIRLGEDRDGVGDAARGDPDLAAGDDVLVAVPLGAGLHAGGVAAGAGLR